MAWQYAQLTISCDTRATLGLETTQTITWHEPNQDNGDDLRSAGSPNGPGQHTPAVVWRAGPALPPPAVSLRGLQ